MYNYLKKRNEVRIKRALRVRKKLRGSEEKPRLCVCKTNKHLSAQVIDDEKGVTLFSFGTQAKDFAKDVNGKSKAAAKIIGEKIAEAAKTKNIDKLVFDRGRLKYHGIIAELVSAVRDAGLKI